MSSSSCSNSVFTKEIVLFMIMNLYLNMTWLDPQYWQEGPNNGKDKILQLINYFQVPLAAVNFDKTKVLTERRSFQVTRNRYYKDFIAKSPWEKMFQYKKKEFSNLLILVKRVICFSLLNSAVETTFSLLTTSLNDRRLSMRHDTMEDCILLAGNNSNWSEQEKEEILNKAVEKYQQKKPKIKIADATKESLLASHIDES